MGGFSRSKSYIHWCKYNERQGDWDIGWTYDIYYSGSHLRFPQRWSRSTDERGAKRFCKRWSLEFPAAKE